MNRQVKRNQNRFPEDFMFQLTFQEYEVLRCQIGISNEGKGGRRYQLLVFTTPRGFHLLERNDGSKIDKLKNDTNKVFKIVFERLDDLEDRITPKYPSDRRIGKAVR